MRFEQTLANAVYAPWKASYIDYNKLKKLLRDDEDAQVNSVWTDDDAEFFYAELTNVQLDKVQTFHRETYRKLKERAAACEATLDNLTAIDANSDAPSSSRDTRNATLRSSSTELDSISKEINELARYSRVNYTGFLKIAKKHDRKRGGRISVGTPLRLLLAKVPFNQEDYAPLLYRVSVMWTFIRAQLQDTDRRPSVISVSVGDDDPYVSYKFWVHYDNILEVKTMILRHLPMLVYAQNAAVSSVAQRDPTMTSLYFDNTEFDLYTAKVEHSTPASSLRLRWTDHLSTKPDVLLERKVIEEDDKSTEIKIPVKDRQVQSILRGQYDLQKQIEKLRTRAGETPQSIDAFESNVKAVQSMIKEQKLQPMMRANYTRTAFHIPGDNKLKISLDTNLAFIREDTLDDEQPARQPDSWHRQDIDTHNLEYPFSTLPNAHVHRFPHAVLEIKQRGLTSRAWVTDLMSSHLVKEAPRFSKFVHGVSRLFDDHVNTFPFWLSSLEQDIRQAPAEAVQDAKARKIRQDEDDSAVGSLALHLRTKIGRTGSLSSPNGPSFSQGTSFRNSPRVTSSSYEVGSSPKSHRQSRRYSTRRQSIPTSVIEDDEPEAAQPDASDSTKPTKQTGVLSSLSVLPYVKRKHKPYNNAPLPPGISEPEQWIKDQGPVKVEAKVWLANQRTYVKWQNVSILLVTLSVALYNTASVGNELARTVAIVYTLLAVFIGVWGWWVYVWRSRLIRERSGKSFDALTGPIVVCVSLLSALILNFVFAMKEVV